MPLAQSASFRLSCLPRSRAAAILPDLAAPVSIQSLAVVRVVFGALMLWDVWRFFKHNRIYRYYVQPDFHFTYPGFSWVAPLPEPYIYWAWGLVGVFALMVMIGFLYRFAIVGFTLVFTYFFLLDQAQYLNHFYMVILYAMLLCTMPAGRAYSVDAWLWPGLRRQAIAYWSVFALRVQTEIILVYAGIVKITEDWLKGEPLGLWLRAQAAEFPLGYLFYIDWVILTGAWGTIALHIIGAPLLLWSKTRLPVFLIYCVFHVSNAYFFNIGIFPWLTIGITTIFFAPDWPQRFSRWLVGWHGSTPPLSEPGPAPAVSVSRWTITALAVWIGLQIAIPLRYAAFPTEVRWSGDGHRFAWRMRMYNREARGHFLVNDPASRQIWRVNPTNFLTRRQAMGMMTRPDMILQFAHHLERLWQARGYTKVNVHAIIEKSLNGRPFQPYIRPDTDLTQVSLNLAGPDNWVLPLTTPFRHWRDGEVTTDTKFGSDQ